MSRTLLDDAGSMRGDSALTHDYKGRPRMVSSQHGMVAADQGDCSAMGAQTALGAVCVCVSVPVSACLPFCVYVSVPVCLPVCVFVSVPVPVPLVCVSLFHFKVSVPCSTKDLTCSTFLFCYKFIRKHNLLSIAT